MAPKSGYPSGASDDATANTPVAEDFETSEVPAQAFETSEVPAQEVESPVHSEEQIDVEDQETTIIEQLQASEDLMSDVAGSSDDTLDTLTQRFKDMKLEIDEKMKIIAGVQSNRATVAKAKAKAVAKAKTKAESEAQTALDNARIYTFQVRFMGRLFTVSVAGGTTVGGFRRRIIRAINQFLPAGKKLHRDMARKLFLVNGTVQLHEKARALVKTRKIKADDVLEASFAQSIENKIELLPAVVEAEAGNQDGEDSDEDDDETDED